MPLPVLRPTEVAPGDRVALTVDLSADCVDTNHPGPSLPRRQWRGVRITLVDNGSQTPLATLDSDRDGRISTDLTIPEGAAPGSALVRVDGARDATLTIR